MSSSTAISCSSSSDSDSGDLFHLPTASSSRNQPFLKQKKKVIESVAMTLDRVNMSDRNATFVIAATAKALGHDLEELPISRSTIRRSRMKTRQAVATNIKNQPLFSQGLDEVNTPLLLHWDGKLLPDILKGVEKVDRIAVLVSGGGEDKLLGVPLIDKGTGQAQADICLKILDEWGLRNRLRGLVFDTTASNTGLKSGACSLIEKALGHSLAWIACRHHVFEIVLANVFSKLFGSCGGPDIPLFKRFKGNWPLIVKENYKIAGDELFEGSLMDSRQEMITFLSAALANSIFPRDDYLELISLCLVFLGGYPSDISFRAPGGFHQARWMAKAIYSLKIYLFREQTKLTSREEKNLKDISLFIAIIYARYWHEASLAVTAPKNDLAFLTALEDYPNRQLADVAIKTFKRHLWYFSEYLIGLSFFDDRVESDTKAKMMANLTRSANANEKKRLDASSFSTAYPLEHYVTERTTELFDVLYRNGKKMAEEFLSNHPSEWAENESYKLLKDKAMSLKVVNDSAERAIALITHYNSTITKDEQQKQFILQIVEAHRKSFPTASKAALM